MLLLIWFVVGLLLGLFVNRRAVALSLSATLWVISGATIAARSGYLLPLDADSVGVVATLIFALVGCLAGALVRKQQAASAAGRSSSLS